MNSSDLTKMKKLNNTKEIHEELSWLNQNSQILKALLINNKQIMNEAEKGLKPEILIIIQELNKINYELRLEYFKKILKKFKEKNTKKQCKITTKNELNAEEKKRIKEKIQKKYMNNQDLDFLYITDKNINNGLIFEVENKIFDATVKTMLQNIKKEVINGIKFQWYLQKNSR